MKKLLVLLSLFALFTINAFAAPSKSKVSSKTTIHCAVLTGNVLNIAKATKNHMYTDYHGRRYFFCCNGCPQAFKKDPQKYTKNDSIPTPKKKSPKKQTPKK